MKRAASFRNIKKIDLHKFVPRMAQKGTSPGTVEYIGKPRQETIGINMIAYDEASVEEKQIVSLPDLKTEMATAALKWVQISGVHNTDFLNQLGEQLGINSLDVEAIANTTQRPIMIERENYIFVVLKTLQLEPITNEVIVEQVSMILGDRFVVSFHETTPALFDALRNRISATKSRIRRFSSDYLLFALCDIVIDQYFSLLENVGETIEAAEDELIMSPVNANQEAIYKLKRRLVYAKKMIWPTREVITALQISEHELINDDTRIYFRDIYDHTVQLIESLDSLREITSGMMDLYMSAISNRLNEIMKVLTLFSAFFIPITFLAGVYGMNFKTIPETGWTYGYLAFWGVVVVISVGMIFYFKRKKWF
ncbi:magnesium/cobalt transporter CorA [Paludibacter sp.]|uniref:magnesium/cobalt transporter CorA n=1 Tax=Paludibacter sp. TaxID=1898105 RepID=UPI001354C550|nr:magnesium/cobalt transporter CorA [Paludibacter sp.]MTK53562.1 magnesium/cobalt transporter CorA [Paludibacter sp.]